MTGTATLEREVGVHRYYDPTTGQFLSVDPAVDTTGEPYPYAASDPVNQNDPSGLSATDCSGSLCLKVTGRRNFVSGIQVYLRNGAEFPNGCFIHVAFTAPDGSTIVQNLGELHFAPPGSYGIQRFWAPGHQLQLPNGTIVSAWAEGGYQNRTLHVRIERSPPLWGLFS